LILETFHTAYEERAKHCRTRAGARELLNWLQENKIDALLLSNHTTEGIENQLKRLGIEKFFCKVLANEDKRTALKDKSKKLEEYLKKNHYKKKNMILVGDAPEEVKIARQLGATSVALTGGYYSTKRLKEARPDCLIGGLREVKGVVGSG